MDEPLHWLNPTGVQSLMNRLKEQLFQSSLQIYFALGLGCSYPVLTALSFHWPSRVEADEVAGRTLQIEFWHAIRHDLAFRAIDAGWTVSRSDLFTDLAGRDEVEKAIDKELGLLFRPRHDPRLFEMRLPGTLPWLPRSAVEVSCNMQRIGCLSMERTHRPQTFAMSVSWSRDAFMPGTPLHRPVSNQQLTALYYHPELKEILDTFWVTCVFMMPTTLPVYDFPQEIITAWGDARMEKARLEIEMNVPGNPEPVQAICSNCRTRFETLVQCSGCKVIKYCDRICQNKHWRQHKTKCKELNTRRLWERDREQIREAINRRNNNF